MFVTDAAIDELASKPGWDWHSAYLRLLTSAHFDARGMRLRENSRSEVEAEGSQPGPDRDAPDPSSLPL